MANVAYPSHEYHDDDDGWTPIAVPRPRRRRALFANLMVFATIFLAIYAPIAIVSPPGVTHAIAATIETCMGEMRFCISSCLDDVEDCVGDFREILTPTETLSGSPTGGALNHKRSQDS